MDRITMPRDSRERTPVYIYIYIHVVYTLSLHYTMYTVYQVEVEKSSGHSLYGHVESCTKNVFMPQMVFGATVFAQKPPRVAVFNYSNGKYKSSKNDTSFEFLSRLLFWACFLINLQEASHVSWRTYTWCPIGLPNCTKFIFQIAVITIISDHF